MKKRICCVLLEYCGGQKTDALYLKLARWNPDYKINMLDNASQHNRSGFITHQNERNSGIGGGIIDSINIAKAQGAKYLLLITNDIIPITRIRIEYFECILRKHPKIIQLSASITSNSDQGSYYPWMINEKKQENRIVPHSDILCCAMDIEFIESFGGFPVSESGWGYDWEMAYQAKLLHKKIVITDLFTIKHVNHTQENVSRMICEKQNELRKIYDLKYGSYRKIFDPLNAYCKGE